MERHPESSGRRPRRTAASATPRPAPAARPAAPPRAHPNEEPATTRSTRRTAPSEVHPTTRRQRLSRDGGTRQRDGAQRNRRTATVLPAPVHAVITARCCHVDPVAP